MSTTTKLVRGLVWTVGGYASSIVVRFGSNVILTRLLSPELYGMLLIVNTVRQGVELSSDVGFAQNVVHNPNGEKATFYNTVWIMQIVRAAMLGVILFLCAAPIARLYSVPVTAFEISAAMIIVSGWTSTAIFLLHRTMQLGKLNAFDLAQDGVGAAIVILAAIFSPTIVSVLIGGLLGQLVRTLSSHLLLPERNRFMFNRAAAVAVLTFGRWLFLSSILSFLCASFDRLYVGKVAPLAVLGVYGLARSLAEMPIGLVARIGYSVIFPLIASAQNRSRAELRIALRGSRIKLLASAAPLLALAIAASDFAVRIVYDIRYHDAEWMLPLLLTGVWPALLCSVNEYTLLGVGRPVYNVAGNAFKLAYLLAALPWAIGRFGILGAIIVVTLGEAVRYGFVAFGQWRERISFTKQDIAATVMFGLFIALFCCLRWSFGLGTPFDKIPFDQIDNVRGQLN